MFAGMHCNGLKQTENNYMFTVTRHFSVNAIITCILRRNALMTVIFYSNTLDRGLKGHVRMNKQLVHF